jgi:hypothetical protein
MNFSRMPYSRKQPSISLLFATLPLHSPDDYEFCNHVFFIDPCFVTGQREIAAVTVAAADRCLSWCDREKGTLTRS